MFGKQSAKSQRSEKPQNLQDIQLSPPETLSAPASQSDTLFQAEPQVVPESELVNTVEKISRIVSPYFVVIVGLALYENNFLFGTILIATGILSLLKVSANDVAAFFEWLKQFFGFDNTQM
ncbi:hypothetical protein [Myxosarcina sp. GI1]|uniref:hypothetical protein n=1 Tax=Myxosarcina sp. GI1 TaxID=1541065 RepID=UPI00055C3C07|nr:hypothetical protein [Myxosarcina sp. GI1]